MSPRQINHVFSSSYGMIDMRKTEAAGEEMIQVIFTPSNSLSVFLKDLLGIKVEKKMYLGSNEVREYKKKNSRDVPDIDKELDLMAQKVEERYGRNCKFHKAVNQQIYTRTVNRQSGKDFMEDF